MGGSCTQTVYLDSCVTDQRYTRTLARPGAHTVSQGPSIHLPSCYSILDASAFPSWRLRLRMMLCMERRYPRTRADAACDPLMYEQISADLILASTAYTATGLDRRFSVILNQNCSCDAGICLPEHSHGTVIA